MSVLQAILIALFVYLGSIGSVVGNTLGWYDLGRPLVASFIVGLIMGNVPVAVALGLLLQLANLGSVTPGGAVVIQDEVPTEGFTDINSEDIPF